MQVFANIRQEVTINPLDVLKKLYEKELYWRNWVLKKEDRYYEGWEESAGCHGIEMEKEITKERYEYIQALKLVINKLENDIHQQQKNEPPKP